MKKDFLIVGQGLAGSALAVALKRKGKSVTVVDHEDPCSASRMAAGLITTLAGKGMNPGWRQAEYLPQAMAYYRELEEETETRFVFEMPIVRPFDDQKQAEKFERKKADLSCWLSESKEAPKTLKNEFGEFWMSRGGRLDTQTYLQAVRDWLGDDYQVGEVEFDESCEWQGIEHEVVIYCMGYHGLLEDYFGKIPHRSAKGEMLTVHMPQLSQYQIISRNGWLVPLGDGLWRAGATYEWDDLTTTPTDEGKADVERRIQALVDSEYTIKIHNAGVRPIVNNSQPIIGLSKQNSRVGIFNALGSKGVITAPSVAQHFADYLCGECELDPELNYERVL